MVPQMREELNRAPATSARYSSLKGGKTGLDLTLHTRKLLQKTSPNGNMTMKIILMPASID